MNEEHLHREWPEYFFDFEPIKDAPDFKYYSDEFKPLNPDPFS